MGEDVDEVGDNEQNGVSSSRMWEEWRMRVHPDLAQTETHEEAECRHANLHLHIMTIHFIMSQHRCHSILWRRGWLPGLRRGRQCVPAPPIFQFDHAWSAGQHATVVLGMVINLAAPKHLLRQRYLTIHAKRTRDSTRQQVTEMGNLVV